MVGWVALTSELAKLGLAVRRGLGPSRVQEVVPAMQGHPKLLEAFYASPKGNFFTKGRGTGKTGKGKSKAK